MATKTKLSVVKPTDTNSNAPPAILSKTGAALWASITTENDITDAGRRETLLQGCLAADRAAECAGFIERNGPVVDGQNGRKEHPLLKTELACRSFVICGLSRLGVAEPKKRLIGRPPSGFGWVPPDER